MRQEKMVAGVKHGTRRRGDRVNSPELSDFFDGILRAGNNETDFALVPVGCLEERVIEDAYAP
jgi:hypothetical protein